MRPMIINIKIINFLYKNFYILECAVSMSDIVSYTILFYKK